MKKNQENKGLSLTARIIAGVLCAILALSSVAMALGFLLG